MSECDICDGSRNIVLPVRRDVALVETESSMGVTARTYPCPQCAAPVSVERVAEISTLITVSTNAGAPKPGSCPKMVSARELAWALIDGGFVNFERGPEDRRAGTFSLRGSVSVVAPEAVATLEERIRRRQDEVATEVVAAAKADIKAWGSDYGVVEISKRRAIAALDDALRTVRAARSG